MQSSSKETTNPTVVGCFQFFYASADLDLPNPDVPTRDVTNTWKAGHKTEPFLERRLENWCACRALMVAPRVREALAIKALKGDHYMILTTKRPTDGDEFAVGVLRFSRRAHTSLLNKFPNRWTYKHQPYPGNADSKVVGFSQAYSLKPWMNSAGKRRRYMPGLRYGIVKAPPLLLRKILKHFAPLTDRTSEFLANVRYLEKKFERNGPSAEWIDYKARKAGRKARACKCAYGRTC